MPGNHLPTRSQWGWKCWLCYLPAFCIPMNPLIDSDTKFEVGGEAGLNRLVRVGRRFQGEGCGKRDLRLGATPSCPLAPTDHHVRVSMSSVGQSVVSWRGVFTCRVTD